MEVDEARESPDKPTRRDVIRAFRLILGRPPENERTIEDHRQVATIAELGRILLASEEFAGKYRTLHPTAVSHPDLYAHRRTVVLIHLQKTGGTSLRDLIGRHFPPDRRCPVLEDKLHLLSPAELAAYDFYSGHFGVSSLRFIPRDSIETVAFFREPHARLVSLYRFLRSHPDSDEFSGDLLIPWAHKLSAEEFFELPLVRSFSAINNHYYLAFGRSFSWLDENQEFSYRNSEPNGLLEAQSRIRALTGLGITERFDDSVELICTTLGLPVLPAEPKHVTDDFAKIDKRFHAVEAVDMTPRLEKAMADLVRYDLELYRCAVGDFERRFGDGKRTSTMQNKHSTTDD